MLFCFLATTTDSHQAQPNPTLYTWTCLVLYIVPCERIFGGCHLKSFVCILIRISKPLSAFGLTVLFLSHLKSPLQCLTSNRRHSMKYEAVLQSSTLKKYFIYSYTQSKCHQAACTDPCIFSASVVIFVLTLRFCCSHWSLKENDSICSFPATLGVQSTQVYCMVQVRAWFSAVSGNSAQVVLKM